MDTWDSIIEDCEVNGVHLNLGINFILMDSSFLSPTDLRIKMAAKFRREINRNFVPRLFWIGKYAQKNTINTNILKGLLDFKGITRL